jgi:ABC-type branched-subunit amino acid transport system substrate-binding protein
MAVDIPATHLNVASLSKSAKKAGMSVVNVSYFPATASDYTPYVAAVKKANADSVVLLADQTANVVIVQTGSQLGLKVAWSTAISDFGPQQVSQLGAAANGAVLTDNTPETATSGFPGVTQFHQDMDAAAKAGVQYTNRFGKAFTSWIGVYAVHAVGSTIHGAVTSASLWTALNSAHNVNLEGIYSWNPSASGPSAYPRYPTDDVWLNVVKDGKIELTSPTPLHSYALQGLS